MSKPHSLRLLGRAIAISGWLTSRTAELGSVLASIDALPDAMTGHKSALKIQMLHRAGLLPQAANLSGPSWALYKIPAPRAA